MFSPLRKAVAALQVINWTPDSSLKGALESIFHHPRSVEWGIIWEESTDERHLTSTMNLSTNLLKFGSPSQQEVHVGLAYVAGIISPIWQNNNRLMQLS